MNLYINQSFDFIEKLSSNIVSVNLLQRDRKKTNHVYKKSITLQKGNNEIL